MRFVLAIISFVLAAVMMGSGVAQRTIFRGPDEAVLTTSVSTDSAVTVIDGSALTAFEGNQSLKLSGSSTAFAAYGRTSDVLAWIGDTEYTKIGLDQQTGQLSSALVPGTETQVPNPSGSDLWLKEFAAKGPLSMAVSVPDDVSFIVVSDGIAPAPSDITVSWPLDNSTPWSGPLITAGAGALLLGLFLLLWAIHHMRSTRGPRRKMPKVPKKPQYKPSRKAIQKPASGRRAVRSSMIAVPLLLVGALGLSACSTGGPLAGARVVPMDATTATAPASDNGSEAGPPVVTVPQMQRIISEVSATNTTADQTRDSALLATRFDGAALELRTANYTIVGADASIPAIAAIPDGPVKITLPQQSTSWPRAVMVIIQNDNDTTVPSLALFLEQKDPRSNYKVSYSITLEPSETIPDVAPAVVGTARLLPDNQVLRFSPTEVALSYADVLDKGQDSPFYSDFESEGDTLRTAVADYRASVRSSLPATATVAFGSAIGAAEPIVLATNDNGALIAVNLNETTTVTPVEAGAAVNPSGQVKALSGLAISTKGVIATYSDQLLFYVPAAGKDGKITLLGYTQGLVKAGEVG